MKRLAITAVFAALSTSSIFATSITINSVNGVQDLKSDNVGPYPGTLTTASGSTNYSVFCDDLAHNIGIGASENVNVSTISNLSLTRFGGASASTSTVAVADYEQIFYLSTYLAQAAAGTLGTPKGYTTGDGQSVQADIQDAMWSYYDPTGVPAAASTQIQYWKTQAANNYQNYVYNTFEILTDSSNQYNGVQELFVNTSPSVTTLSQTPEPATIAMFAGAAAIFLFNKRRQTRIT